MGYGLENTGLTEYNWGEWHVVSLQTLFYHLPTDFHRNENIFYHRWRWFYWWKLYFEPYGFQSGQGDKL